MKAIWSSRKEQSHNLNYLRFPWEKTKNENKATDTTVNIEMKNKISFHHSRYHLKRRKARTAIYYKEQWLFLEYLTIHFVMLNTKCALIISFFINMHKGFTRYVICSLLVTDFKSKPVWLQKHCVILPNSYIKWQPKLFL